MSQLKHNIDLIITLLQKDFYETFDLTTCSLIMFKKTKTNKNTPKGIRTPAASVKGMCPRPLDDGSI
jgi:hypothetical protein